MANVLSQEELDALLGGLSGGQIETSQQGADVIAPEATISTYDFTDTDRFIRGRMPTLETIHDRFSRLLRLNLSTTLRRAVEIQVTSQTLCTFGDFSQSLEKPSSLHLLKLEPLNGHGLLVMPGRLILTLVDLLFGGDGRPVEINIDRDFSLIEQRVVEKIAGEFCKCYAESWAPVYPLDVFITGSETNVQFINIAQPSDPVNVVDCDVIIEGNRTSLSLCLPYAMIEPLKDTLKGAFINEKTGIDSNAAQRMRGTLDLTSVELCGKLGTATITLRDLMEMKDGDILQLNEDYEHPVEILVQGERKFWGTVGGHKSTRALQITGIEETRKAKKD